VAKVGNRKRKSDAPSQCYDLQLRQRRAGGVTGASYLHIQMFGRSAPASLQERNGMTGRSCGHRVRKLYLPSGGGYFACRQRWQFGYAIQRKNALVPGHSAQGKKRPTSARLECLTLVAGIPAPAFLPKFVAQAVLPVSMGLGSWAQNGWSTGKAATTLGKVVP